MTLYACELGNCYGITKPHIRDFVFHFQLITTICLRPHCYFSTSLHVHSLASPVGSLVSPIQSLMSSTDSPIGVDGGKQEWTGRRSPRNGYQTKSPESGIPRLSQEASTLH